MKMENTNSVNDAKVLIEHIESIKENFISQNEKLSLFKTKMAKEWIEGEKNNPPPTRLFGEFWHKDEVCILFADTNLGKSILAVQIADSISRGESIQGFDLESDKQSVLYFDFELSAMQFTQRYSNRDERGKFLEAYSFDDNFLRIEINTETEVPEDKDFEFFFYNELERAIIKSKTKILIIDNITYLKSGTETSKDALPLMKYLIRLRNKFRLSILVLAHTPKRDLSKPITRNDLQGSKMLINFADSAFTLGESSVDKNLRYIKQIKARNTGIIYDAENVAICEILKENSFLSFIFLNFGIEKEHLKEHSKSDRDQKIMKVKELSDKGHNQREIATELGIALALGTVNKYLKL